MRTMPNTVVALIEELEADFPPKCKSPDESLDAHMTYAGKVELVTYLRARLTAELRQVKGQLPNILNK